MLGDWLKDQLQSDRDEAVRRRGQEEGKIEAIEQIRSYLDPEKRCQVCGHHFYGEKKTQEDHYSRYPDHRPGYVPPSDQ